MLGEQSMRRHEHVCQQAPDTYCIDNRGTKEQKSRAYFEKKARLKAAYAVRHSGGEAAQSRLSAQAACLIILLLGIDIIGIDEGVEVEFLDIDIENAVFDVLEDFSLELVGIHRAAFAILVGAEVERA